MGDAWISVLIGVLKGLAVVYDVITFIPWFLLDNPQRKLQQSRRVKVSDAGGSWDHVDGLVQDW